MSALVAALELTSHALTEATHKLDALAVEVADAESDRKKLEKNLSGALDALSDLLDAVLENRVTPTDADLAREALIKFGSV